MLVGREMKGGLRYKQSRVRERVRKNETRGVKKNIFPPAQRGEDYVIPNNALSERMWRVLISIPALHPGPFLSAPTALGTSPAPLHGAVSGPRQSYLVCSTQSPYSLSGLHHKWPPIP